LEMMERAIFADKKNPLPKYQKALILLGLQRYPEALDELEWLKAIAPHESSMYALMGKIYKQLNILDKAVFCFGIALDLKPPAADLAIIKVWSILIFFPAPSAFYFPLCTSVPAYLCTE
jgi:anaphase-promoting complex subunit 3